MKSLLPRIAYFVHELSLSVPYQMRRVLFKLYHKESLLCSSKLKLPFKARKLIFDLFPAKLYEKKICDNIYLYLDIKSRDESYIYHNGYWEKEATTLMQKFIKKGDIVFDVGANIGYYTLIFANTVGDKGRVFAFEPCPRNIRNLENNVRRNSFQNIVIERTALGENSQTMQMYFPCDVQFGAGGFFKARSYLAQQEVGVVTLDDFIKKEGITRIDFLKLDIEGGEIFALRGMSETLNQKIIRNAFIDIHDTILLRNGYKPQEIKKYMIKYGYTLYKVVADQFVPASVDSEDGGYFLASVSNRMDEIVNKLTVLKNPG
jgi:FkbM family methyltransferase